MKKVTPYIYILFFLTTCMVTFAETTDTKPIEMADAMRDSGKIYVVVAVLSIIFLCIIGYLISLEQKIKAIEKSISEKQ